MNDKKKKYIEKKFDLVVNCQLKKKNHTISYVYLFQKLIFVLQ